MSHEEMVGKLGKIRLEVFTRQIKYIRYKLSLKKRIILVRRKLEVSSKNSLSIGELIVMAVLKDELSVIDNELSLILKEADKGFKDFNNEFYILFRKVLISFFLNFLKSYRINLSVPRFPEYILKLIIPKKFSDGLLGDFEEEFRKVNSEFGCIFAYVWYWKQTIISVWFLISNCLRK